MDEVEQLLLFDGANGTNATAAIWEPVVDINGTAAFNGSTAEEAHFLVALSLYGLACLLLAAIYATRGRPGARFSFFWKRTACARTEIPKFGSCSSDAHCASQVCKGGQCCDGGNETASSSTRERCGG